MSTNDGNTSTNVTTPTVTSNSTTAQPSKLLSGSFNSWDEPTKRRRIDYIFVRGNLQVQNISLMVRVLPLCILCTGYHTISIANQFDHQFYLYILGIHFTHLNPLRLPRFVYYFL